MKPDTMKPDQPRVDSSATAVIAGEKADRDIRQKVMTIGMAPTPQSILINADFKN